MALNVANYNIPDQQLVISGENEAVDDTIMQIEFKRGRVIPIAVTIPAHTPLMKVAEERFTKAMESVKVLDPAVAMVANQTGRLATKASEIRENVPKLTRSVRWGQGVELMHRLGVRDFTEFGPRTVLQGMVGRHLKGRDAVVRSAEAELYS